MASSGRKVRAVGGVRGVDYSNYEDAVMTIDCAPFWRRFRLHRCPCVPRNLWFVKDVCGVVCAFITWGLVAYASFVIFFVILLPEPNVTHSIVNAVIYALGAFMAVASHVRSMTS